MEKSCRLRREEEPQFWCQFKLKERNKLFFTNFIKLFFRRNDSSRLHFIFKSQLNVEILSSSSRFVESLSYVIHLLINILI